METTTVEKGSRKLLWIGWDGADWEHVSPLLERGLLPNLNKLINEGVMANLATLQPILSPMLWNSAATGKYAYKHGILGFTETNAQSGSVRPFSSYSRGCKALWNIFSQNGLKSNVINWWASHPAEEINGCVVSNLFQGIKFGAKGPIVSEGTIHPPDRVQFYGQFKVLPEELGAEQICAFIPKAAEINQDEDSRVTLLAKVLAETLTTHSIATAVMELEPWDFMAVYYTCIDHFGHGFMPYYPPKLPHISEEDFEMFKDVIEGAYRFSDMMLGRMLEFCDEDTTIVVCSDHGFESGPQRPIGQPREPSGPAIWHRDYGMLVVKGPNIKKDEKIFGASLIDIAPTLLTIMGLPVGEDMDGRPLLEIFQNPPEVQTVPSWDDIEGEFPDGMTGEEKPIAPEQAEELMKQFVALGYIDDPSGDQKEQYFSTETECLYNKAQNLLFAGKLDAALQLYQEVLARAPWETRFVQHLVHAYQRSGYFLQARNLLESAFEVENHRFPLIRLNWIELTLALGEGDEEIISKLKVIESIVTQNNANLTNRVGRLYAQMRRWTDAAQAYESSLLLDPENAFALQALSRIYCRLGNYEAAADAGLSAVALIHRLPHAHMNLGFALANLGDAERAVVALQTAIKFSPGFVIAHRYLSLVYSKRLNNPELARHHQVLARKFQTQQSKSSIDRSERARMVFPLPELPTEEERHRTLLEKRPDRGDPRKPSGKEFILVSGLPRSGTSLMMQMLEAGGLPAKTDEERVADSDNPKGYYEWEDIKRISRKPQLLEEPDLEEKAIKVISMLLTEMPYAHNYKVIFMTRPVEEVVASQGKMIDRLQTEGAAQSEDEVAKSLVLHRNGCLNWMRHHKRIEFLEVDYPSLVESPRDVIPLIADFLGRERLPHPERMAEVVDPALHRRRKS